MSKYYRHYKNKPYKYLGEVRHSETLDELVLYEARYPNELGKLWVRPKKMFFENINVDGKVKPRFEKIEVDYKATNSISNKDQENILSLLNLVFGGYSKEKFESTLKNHNEILLVTAHIENNFVGFKLGYAYRMDRFYSWLGAVHPDWRGLGIAQELMDRQHQWCREKNFEVIETRTSNKWKEMLLLNINNRFHIVGTYTNKKGEPKIILEKRIK